MPCRQVDRVFLAAILPTAILGLRGLSGRGQPMAILSLAVGAGRRGRRIRVALMHLAIRSALLVSPMTTAVVGGRVAVSGLWSSVGGAGGNRACLTHRRATNCRG